MAHKILFFLPSLSKYEDRIKTIAKVSKNKIYFIFVINDKKSLVKKIRQNNHSVIFLSEIIPIRIFRIIFQQYIILFLSLYYQCKILHLTSYTVNPLVAFLFCKLFNKKYFVSLYILYSSRFKLFTNYTLIAKLKSTQIRRMYLYALHEYLLLPLVDKLIMQASGLANNLPFYKIYKNKVSIIKNSISYQKIEWNPKTYKPTKDNLRILYVGGIDYTRGVDKIIDAISSLNKEGFKINLNLVGKIGDYFSKELNKVNKKNIKILNRKKRKDLFNYALDHDIFIYPTLNEGSPRIILEMASLGIPIIASKHPGIIEIDKECKFINFLDGDKNIEYYIINYLSNQKLFIQKAICGRNYVLENNSLEKISKVYEKNYIN